MLKLIELLYKYFKIAVLLLAPAALLAGQNINSGKWQIVLGSSIKNDEAIRVAVKDLQRTGSEYGIDISIADEEEGIHGNTILVGGVAGNKVTAGLVAEGQVELLKIEDAQSYQVVTKNISGNTVVVISGGSVVGEVYGLYWLWDRIRVFKSIPEINTFKSTPLKTRVHLTWGRRPGGGGSKDEMRKQLRYGLNWVAGNPVLDLVPWNSEPEKTKNEKYREETRELIEYSHSLHLKYYSFATDFTFHPSLMEEFDASLNPEDPNYWKAVKAKYRRLLQSLPELDGVQICLGDVSGFWDNYRAFDMMENEVSDWAPEKVYRTFIKNVWDVVVGEFDKTLLVFTWGLTIDSQHYSAEAFRRIFTEDVPTRNLYLIPKITQGDRNWHMAYNPTFNQSEHTTLVGFEKMNYYEAGSSNIFPTFSGGYFQGGLQTFLSANESNVKGVGYLLQSGKSNWSWNTVSAYSYALYRLQWEPNGDVKQIAEDFCAINFGQDAAEDMAEIFINTSVAYKYGLYIEPTAYGKFNNFPQLRVGTFPAMGYPSIDGGREHMELLQSIYYRCKPWLTETLDDLDHGLDIVEEMVRKYQTVKDKIVDVSQREEIENRLNMSYWLIVTNNQYVKTTFAYFQYRENPTAEFKDVLLTANIKLKETRSNFISSPGFGYRLFGVNQLIKNADEALLNLEEAEIKLEKMPTRKELEATIASQQKLYKKVFEKQSGMAVKFMDVEIRIDGRDILIIKGSDYEIEHLRWDGPQIVQLDFVESLPQKNVTVIPVDIESNPMHQFILEQPSGENNYTVKVYLYDKPAGTGVMKFALYYIDKTPSDLGLDFPWE